MAVSRDQVLAFLTPDEPDYAGAAELGPEALPILEELLDDMDQDVHPGIPAKATSLAGMIGGPEATDVLKIASASPDPTVRVAAAAAASYLSSEQAAEVLDSLIKDQDLGVQKTALMAAPSIIPAALKRSIESIDASSSDPTIVDLRDKALRRDVEARTEHGRTPDGLDADMGGEHAESTTSGMPGGDMPATNGTTDEVGEATMPYDTTEDTPMPSRDMPATNGTTDEVGEATMPYDTTGDTPMPSGDMR